MCTASQGGNDEVILENLLLYSWVPYTKEKAKVVKGIKNLCLTYIRATLISLFIKYAW